MTMSEPDSILNTFQDAKENLLDDLASRRGGELNIPIVTFSLIICVAGLLGNLFAIFVILVLREYKKSVTHWYVLQLAIADSIFLITLPFKVNEEFHHEWTYPEWMCKAKETILFVNYYASILFLIVMSLDRYIAVCHPFSAKSQKLRTKTSAFVITVVVWSLALLHSVPIMLYSAKTGFEPYCKCGYVFPKPRNITEECLSEELTGKFLENCIETQLEIAENEEYCKQNFQSSDSYSAFLNFSNFDHYDPPQMTPPQTNTTGSLDSFGTFTINPLTPPKNNPISLVDFFNSQLRRWGLSQNPSFLNNSLQNVENMTSGSGDGNSSEQGSGSGSGQGYGYQKKTNQPTIESACTYIDDSLGWKVFLVYNFTVMFVLPFMVMVVCYGLIVRQLSKTKFRSTSTASYNKTARNGTSQKKKSSSRSDKERKRVTVMCAALVTCFLVCWLPFHTIHLVKLVGIQSSNKDYCDFLIAIGSLMAYLNSALNPYLYSFLGTNFNRRMKLLKESRGIRQLVSYRPKFTNDIPANSRSKDSEKSNRSQGNKNVGHPSFEKISPQRPTLVTKVQKENDSSQSPSLQTADIEYDSKRYGYNDMTKVTRYSTMSEDLLDKN